jgi:Predicted membrane protein
MRIDRGIMKTDDFMMECSSAKVAISGETDLDKGTQRLHIQVTPSISDSLSLAAFAGGRWLGPQHLSRKKY